MDHKLKLMVVDDSPLFRTWLIRLSLRMTVSRL